MPEKTDKKGEISDRDPKAENNDDKKNDDQVSNLQTNNEETEKEDSPKQTNAENSNEVHSDENKNGKKSGTDLNANQKKDSKTDRDQSEGMKDAEKKSSWKKVQEKFKNHNAKHKKSHSNAQQVDEKKNEDNEGVNNETEKEDQREEMKDRDKKNSKEKNVKKNTKSHKSRHKKSMDQPTGPLSGGYAAKVQDVGGLLKTRATHIQRKGPIDWTRYRDDGAITEEEVQFLNALQHSKTMDERDELLQNSQEDGYYALAKALDCVCSENDDLQKLLVLLHDFLSEDSDRVELMNEASPEVRDTIRELLASSCSTVRHTASQLLVKLLFAPNGRLEGDGIEFFLEWLDEGLDEFNPYLESVVGCFQKLLQVEDYRLAYVEMGGNSKIIKLLTRNNLKTQIQYQLCFCLWVSTFNANIAEKMSRTNVIAIVMDLVERCPSEISKLPRVVVALLRNLLEKPESEEAMRHNAFVSVQCNILQYLELLEPKLKNLDDQEFSQDFEEIRAILSRTVLEASSFEDYQKEVRSGHLFWSVVHTSRAFWTDNAERLNDNEHELLRTLISHLENSDDSTVLCIAAHDIGEYMKQYARGKTMVESLGGKDSLIKLLEWSDQGVKYQALKCLQMLMLDKHDLYSEFFTNYRKIAEMCCIEEEDGKF